MKLAEKQMGVVMKTEWLVPRKDLMTREKEFTHQRDDEDQSSQIID